MNAGHEDFVFPLRQVKQDTLSGDEVRDSFARNFRLFTHSIGEGSFAGLCQ